MGDFQAALKDLNQAIELVSKERERELDYVAGHGWPRRLIDRFELEWKQTMAVMYHHRGEIYQKLGQSEPASADIKRGDKLGYNPAEGVY